MNENNYFKERDFKNKVKIGEILTTLPSFCSDFIVGIENKTTTLTQLEYLHDIKSFFEFLINEIFEFKDKNVKELDYDDLSKITSSHIEYYLNYLSSYSKDNKKILSNAASAKARKLSSIRCLLNYFYKKDKIASNVSAKIDTPKIREKEIIRLEVDEIVKLINEAESPQNFSKRQKSYNEITKKRDVALLTLLLGTGIRVSECVGLNIEDLDFEVNGFKITRKGGSQVVLYFSDEVASALKDYLEERLNNENVDENEKALFLSIQNKRISVRAVEKLVKKYSEACVPLKHITPHKLRSTYGTNLYRETKDIYIVADVLGHKDVNTTKKHYAAISEDARRNVANIIKLRDE